MQTLRGQLMLLPLRSGPPAPDPWKGCKRHDRDLSLLVRGIYEKRKEILAHHPMVRLPTADPKIWTPVAALILAWERWDYVQGKCPKCCGRALGVSFGGLLSIGSVGGVCTKCALMVSRHIGGIGAAVRGAQKSVEGTPYRFRFLNWRWGIQGIPQKLVTVLRRLGVKELPKASRETGEPWGGASFAIGEQEEPQTRR